MTAMPTLKLTPAARTLYFSIVIKTWGFYINQAHYHIEKHDKYWRNSLSRQVLESSTPAEKAFRKGQGRPPGVQGSFVGLLCLATTAPDPHPTRTQQGILIFCFLLCRDEFKSKGKASPWKASVYKEDSYIEISSQEIKMILRITAHHSRVARPTRSWS